MPGLPPTHELFGRAALPAYGRPADTPLRLLSLSENATYLVEDDDPIVLRVHRPGYHSLAAIRSELAVTRAGLDRTDARSVLFPQVDLTLGQGRTLLVFSAFLQQFSILSKNSD